MPGRRRLRRWTAAWGMPEALFVRFSTGQRPLSRLFPLLLSSRPSRKRILGFGQHRCTRHILVLVILTVIVIPFVNQLSYAGWAGPSSTNLGFFGLVTVLGLTGTPQRRIQLSAGTGTGIALLVLIARFAQSGVFHRFYTGDLLSRRRSFMARICWWCWWVRIWWRSVLAMRESV